MDRIGDGRGSKKYRFLVKIIKKSNDFERWGCQGAAGCHMVCSRIDVLFCEKRNPIFILEAKRSRRQNKPHGVLQNKYRISFFHRKVQLPENEILYLFWRPGGSNVKTSHMVCSRINIGFCFFIEKHNFLKTKSYIYSGGQEVQTSKQATWCAPE